MWWWILALIFSWLLQALTVRYIRRHPKESTPKMIRQVMSFSYLFSWAAIIFIVVTVLVGRSGT